MEVRVTHQGRVLAEIEIFPDAQVQVRSTQGAGAPQYVWGAQPASGGGAQYVWGATNERPESRREAVVVDRPGACPPAPASDLALVTEPLIDRQR